MTSRSGLLAALVTALAAASCGAGGAGARRAATPVDAGVLLAPADLVVVQRVELSTEVPVSGTLKPAVDVHITAPLSEVLEAVPVREGQAVVRGQVLARFRATALEPAAASAAAEARVAAGDYERMKNLLAAGAVSERELEGAEARHRAAEAERAAAAKRHDEATVRAPIAGTVARRWVQAGDRVSDGDPLFRLVRNSELELEATVPSEYAPRVRPGAPVRLEVSGVTVALQGRVARVNPTADAATRQVKIYAIVPNPDGRLVSDLFATGAVVLQRSAPTPAVPRAAIRGAGDSTYVWRLARGRIERLPVTIGAADEGLDLIETSGLAPGDSIVVAPAEGLVHGRRVQLRSSAGAGSMATQETGP